jgi:hypothetical protein
MLRRIRQIVANDRGNALFIATLAMPVLIGAGGLATDTIQWTLWNRQIQRQADSAALAGAYARAQGGNVTTSATAEINRHSFVSLSASPVIENAPTTGAYAGDTDAVRVVLQTSNVLPFSSFFLSSPPVITVEATATAITSGEYCVVSLESTTAVGVIMQGNASVNMGCGIITNSKASNAVTAGGSSVIVATPVAAVGGLQSSNNYVSPTTLQPYTIKQSDPYADLPEPVLPTCSGKVTVNPQGTQTISPGCYRGMDLKGTVTLQSGVYYIDGSSFGVGSQATVIGTDVTIILTSNTAATNPGSIATVDINGGANIQLKAPTTGTYAGVLFYQDRRATDSGTNKINGNATSTIQGAIYMPAQAVEFSGTSGMTTNCLKLVSRRVTFTGNNSISNQCTGLGPQPIPATWIRLVE